MFKRTFIRLGVAGFKVVIKGKTLLDVFGLFLEPRFMKRILLRLEYLGRVRNDSFHNSKVSF